MWTRTLGAFACPDVAVTATEVWVTATGGPLPLWRFAHDGTLVDMPHPPGSGGYFPKTDGTTVLYHDGRAFHAWTPGADPADVVLAGSPVGNNPTGLSPGGRRAFQTAAGVACDGVRVADYRPTGIWETHDDGTVAMMDDCNRPSYAPGAGGYAHRAADLVVAEGPDGGVQITQNGQRHLLWAGTDTKWPRVSVWGDLAGIVSWGDHGLRVWVGTRAEIAALPLDVPLVVVPPAPAHLWGCGYFFRDTGVHAYIAKYGGENPSAPGTHSVIVDDYGMPAESRADGSTPRMIVGLGQLLHPQMPQWWDRVDAVYVAVEGDPMGLGNLVALAKYIMDWRHLAQKPVLTYSGGTLYPAAIGSNDILGVQLYALAGVDPVTSIRQQAANYWSQIQNIPRVAVIGQAYDRGGLFTGAQIAAIQPVLYEYACAWPNCELLLWFSDSRAGGVRDYEADVRPWHLAIADALQRRTP